MREHAGFVAFHLAFALPGLALLYALGLVRRPREVPAAIGPAYLAGVAAVMTLLLAGLAAGMGIALPELAVASGGLTVALGLAGVLLARRRADPGPARPSEPEPAGPFEAWTARLGIAAIAAFLVVGNSAFRRLGVVGDDWTIWSYKGLALFHFGGSLDNPLFTGGAPGPAHLDYPFLQPLFESLFFRSVGQIQLQQFHSELWILFAAFVWTVAWLAHSRGLQMHLVVIPTAALAVASESHELIKIGYADVTVAVFVGAGALALGLWMQQGAAGYAILGGTLLAAGANTKNEGVVAAAAVLVAAGGAVVFGDRGRWRPWLAAAVLAAAGTAPTFLWRSSQHLRGSDVAPLGDVLHWNYLVDRLDRVPKSFSALFDQMADPGRWIYIVPCLLALVIVCLIRGVARREAAFYLAVPTLMVLGLVFVYWTGNPEIGYWLTYSADRTITGVVFVCGVGLVHLSALVLGEVSRRPDGAAP